eukprot:gene7059-11222_t
MTVSFSDVFPDFKKSKVEEEIPEEEEKKIEIGIIFDENEKFDEEPINNEKEEIVYTSFLEKFITENNILKESKIEEDIKVSLIINIFNDYFTLISSDESKEPIIIYLNGDTYKFLEEILNGKLLPELLEEIKNFNLNYYDACIYVEINDMKMENGRKKITKLEPSPDLMLYDIYQFLEQNHPELSEKDKITIIEKILLNTKKLCLDPDPITFQISNTIFYNKNKNSIIRKKKKIQNKQKSNFGLIEYIKSNSYKTLSNDIFKNFEEKPKKKTPVSEFKTPELLNPIEFLQSTEKVLHNNKPPTKARILKFQSATDKNKIWKIDVLPVNNGKKYDAIFSQDQDCFSRWHLGTKNSSELYIKRLKDMFQNYGKARCTMDQEVDVNYRNQQQQQQQQQSQSQSQPQGHSNHPQQHQQNQQNQMHGHPNQQHFQVQPISNGSNNGNPQISSTSNARISPQMTSNKPVSISNPNISVRTTSGQHQPTQQVSRSNQPNYYQRNPQQMQQQGQQGQQMQQTQQPQQTTRRNIGSTSGSNSINVRDYRFKTNPMNFPLNISQMNQFNQQRLQMGKQQFQQLQQQQQQQIQMQQPNQQGQQNQQNQPYLNPNNQQNQQGQNQ